MSEETAKLKAQNAELLEVLQDIIFVLNNESKVFSNEAITELKSLKIKSVSKAKQIIKPLYK